MLATRPAGGKLARPGSGSEMKALTLAVALCVTAAAYVPPPAYAAAKLISRADGMHGEPIPAASASSISADGRYVAFAAQGRVFVRDVVAGRTRALDEGEEPDLSADGRRVAYVDGEGQVYVRELRGGGRVLVSRQAYPDSISVGCPVWRQRTGLRARPRRQADDAGLARLRPRWSHSPCRL